MQNRTAAALPKASKLPFLGSVAPAAMCSLALAACSPVRPQEPAAQLAARAVLPASTASHGPTSGQFIAPGRRVATPFVNRQPIQGLSGLLASGDGTFLAVTDNGFGRRETSPDFLLRVYRLRTDFSAGRIRAEASFTLHDPDGHVDFPIVATMDSYPSGPHRIAVDETIVRRRLLTGADFDIESFARMPDGSFWFGDEFGPYLIQTDGAGRVVRPPVSLPGVYSPQHPHLGARQPTAAQSGGFEGMARSADGHRLYPILEKPLEGAPSDELNIYEFDAEAGRYVSDEPFRRYRLGPTATGVSEFVALTERTFLLIERGDGQGAAAAWKKVFRVDFDSVDADGFLRKQEVVDLLRIDDPKRIGAELTTNGERPRFAFPFETPEGLAILGNGLIVVVNDNNYPFGRGRSAKAPDDSELILLDLAGDDP